MILHDFQCEQKHRFEAALPSMHAENPLCPVCATPTRKLMSALHLGNVADAGPSREQMPHSWQGIGGAHPDAVSHWRKKIEKREKLEEKYPELAGDRRPILAHEGIFSKKPLRAGDDIQKATQEALTDQG